LLSSPSSKSAQNPFVRQINVHVVAHSHDDVGWRKTLTEYYYGSSNWIDNGSVQYILDSVVEALVADPRRKFIYVEQAFFSIWWYEQTPAMQEVVRGLVREGRLEFVGGAWCMHDEATTLAVDMIDQTALGHEFITDNFRGIPEAYPNTAWQIDAFGHSGTQAATLTYDWGFDALFFARNDHQDDAQRRLNKATEFVWRASESAGPSNQIFAGTFFCAFDETACTQQGQHKRALAVCRSGGRSFLPCSLFLVVCCVLTLLLSPC
jgi:alpha-mannosidase